MYFPRAHLVEITIFVYFPLQNYFWMHFLLSALGGNRFFSYLFQAEYLRMQMCVFQVGLF
jgi:hypothetical protein